MKLKLIIIFFLISITAYADKPRLVFGIVPLYSASSTAEIWGEFLSEMSENPDFSLIIRTSRKIDDFEARLFIGEYDFAFVTAKEYIMASRYPGYRPLARADVPYLKGVIITHKNSGIKNINDLRNKQIAFSSPVEFASSQYMRSLLNEQGINYHPAYLNSVESVIIAVKNQLYPAGAVLSGFYENDSDLLKVVSTPETETYAIIVHPRVPLPVENMFLKQLTNFSKKNKNNGYFKKLGFSEFIPEKPAFWKNTEKLEYLFYHD
jgi:phosphonate transport system substrate-binding protein